MSRNGSGTYTLPSGNPVVSGTLIEATWANSTLSDIASALTDSLSRSGQGGMTAAFRAFDGTSSVPGIAWGSETTTGWYRAGAGDMRLVVTGSEVMRYQSTGVAVTGTLSATGAATFSSTTQTNGLATFGGRIYLAASTGPTWDTNTYLWAESGFGARYDSFNHRFDVGVTRTLGMVLNSTGNLGIGTSSPAYKLHVQNSASNTDTFVGQSSTVGLFTQWRYNATTASAYGEISTYGGNNPVYIQAQTGGGNTILNWQTGNVGIGTTSPGARVTVAGGRLQVTGNTAPSSGAGVELFYDGVTAGALAFARGTGYLPVALDGSEVRLFTNSSERARITSAGDLLVGTTSVIQGGRYSSSFNGQTVNGIVLQTTFASAGTTFVRFVNSAGNAQGEISANGTTTVAYSTSSDYRLKHNIAPMTGALAKVAALKPCTYKWNADGSDGEGFIAHELAEVVPQAVTGSKDAVDADGNPKYQGIDTSFLVATLTAAIQEQQALIQQLQADVAALKGA